MDPLGKILLVEDQALVAAALRQFFEPRFQIVEVVLDGAGLEPATRRQQPDVVVVNLEIPGLDGLDGVRALCQTFAEVRIVVLGAPTDSDRVRATFAAGADAYLVKSSEPKEFVFAVEEILKGRSYVTPAATRALIEDLRREPMVEPSVTDRSNTPESEQRLRVLLVDDQAVSRLGLEMLLREDPDIEIVGQAADGEEAVERAAALEPDVVLMDLMMPKMNGAEATRAICQAQPAVRVLLTTTLSVGELVLEAVRAGASGYLTKNVESSDLLTALHAVADGKAFLNAEVTRRLLEIEEGGAKAPVGLTVREIEIAAQVAHGLSNQQVADRVFVSEGTVRTHLRNIYEKLGASNRVELALHALRAGWASLDGC